MFIKLTKNHKHLILSVLNNLELKHNKRYTKKDIESINSKYYTKTIDNYFKKKYYGIGYINNNGHMIGYTFIKNPKDRPETATVVHNSHRNKNIATMLRNEIISHRKEFIGNIIYSAVYYENLSSLKSVIKSGFQIFDVTKDGYIQLIKILSYN